MRHRDTPPGEWENEGPPYYKRFRWEGGIKTYETEVRCSGGEYVRQSELPEFAEARQRAIRQALQEPQRKICPIKDARCTGEKCAMFDAAGCVFASAPARITEGRNCPLSHITCGEVCAMYRDGCTLKI